MASTSLGGAASGGASNVNPADLLQRIAKTLRDDVGPAVDAEYPKTQTFMAAVVLQKLGRELALADAHGAADVSDLRSLADDLANARAERDVPQRLADAVDRFVTARDAASLCSVIESLYVSRTVLGDARFSAWLGRIRTTLRAQIDRRLEFSK